MSGPVITLNIHHLSGQPTLTLARGPFVVLELSGYPAQANLLLHTPADCDDLIKAAVTAKDLLLGAQDPPLVMAPECARGNHSGCWDSTDGSHVCECCLNSHPGVPLPEGHGENHIDNAGHATLATCPECGGAIEPDGSHYARSGAHIAAVSAR